VNLKYSRREVCSHLPTAGPHGRRLIDRQIASPIPTPLGFVVLERLKKRAPDVSDRCPAQNRATATEDICVVVLLGADQQLSRLRIQPSPLASTAFRIRLRHHLLQLNAIALNGKQSARKPDLDRGRHS
jgi:hypothetical protein